MYYDIAFRLEKMKAETSKWFHCKTSGFLFFLLKIFKDMQKLFQITI